LLALFSVLLVWTWAPTSFWQFPVPLGTALLADSLGLRSMRIILPRLTT
jgi:hypothetical protein